jgi:hypothetical protein
LLSGLAATFALQLSASAHAGLLRRPEKNLSDCPPGQAAQQRESHATPDLTSSASVKPADAIAGLVNVQAAREPRDCRPWQRVTAVAVSRFRSE